MTVLYSTITILRTLVFRQRRASEITLCRPNPRAGADSTFNLAEHAFTRVFTRYIPTFLTFQISSPSAPTEYGMCCDHHYAKRKKEKKTFGPSTSALAAQQFTYELRLSSITRVARDAILYSYCTLRSTSYTIVLFPDANNIC